MWVKEAPSAVPLLLAEKDEQHKLLAEERGEMAELHGIKQPDQPACLRGRAGIKHAFHSHHALVVLTGSDSFWSGRPSVRPSERASVGQSPRPQLVVRSIAIIIYICYFHG